MTADRAGRATAAVEAAIAFLAQDERHARALEVHRPDGSHCVGCGEVFPCRTAGLAGLAAARVREAAVSAPDSPSPARRGLTRWLGTPNTTGASQGQKGAL